MIKKNLIEKGIHKTFHSYWNNPKAKIIPNQRKIWNFQNIKAFWEYLWRLVIKQPLIGEYIQSLYNEWKDIMRLYRFFYSSKSDDFNVAKLSAHVMYTKRDSIQVSSLAEHISLNEFTESSPIDEDI